MNERANGVRWGDYLAENHGADESVLSGLPPANPELPADGGMQQVISLMTTATDPAMQQQLLNVLAGGSASYLIGSDGSQIVCDVVASSKGAVPMSAIQPSTTTVPSHLLREVMSNIGPAGSSHVISKENSPPGLPPLERASVSTSLLQNHLGHNSPFNSSPEQPSRTSSASPPEQPLYVSTEHTTADICGSMELSRQVAMVHQQRQQLEALQRNLAVQAGILNKMSDSPGTAELIERIPQQVLPVLPDTTLLQQSKSESSSVLMQLLEQQQKQLQHQQEMQRQLLKALQIAEQKSEKGSPPSLQRPAAPSPATVALPPSTSSMPSLSSLHPPAKKRKASSTAAVESTELMDVPGKSNVDTTEVQQPDSTSQRLKFHAHRHENWNHLADVNGKALPRAVFQLEADKGFNFSLVDNAFICQKKNHFQLTGLVTLPESAFYVNTKHGLSQISHLALNAYGTKIESPLASNIELEQSQANRNKIKFDELRLELNPDMTSKVTVGRLHFSKTTENNGRKKGKPNPDQRYFALVVDINAYCSDGTKSLVASQISERIIVRASNPSQFDNEVDILWLNGQQPDSCYHVGHVGINTDHPEEALAVHGNIRVTGNLLKQSDARLKTNLEEVDSKETLDHIQRLRLYKYEYKPEYADTAGLSEDERAEVGVIAQEVQEVIPEAVKTTGDVALTDGEMVDGVLVVDKDRIYMESVGAVKELCRVTGDLETRIKDLEYRRRRRQQGKQYSIPMTTLRCVGGPGVGDQGKTETKVDDECYKRSPSNTPELPPKYTPECPPHVNQKQAEVRMVVEQKTICSTKFMQRLIIFLITTMLVAVVTMATLYFIDDSTSSPSSSAPTQIPTGPSLLTNLSGGQKPSFSRKDSVLESVRARLPPANDLHYKTQPTTPSAELLPFFSPKPSSPKMEHPAQMTQAQMTQAPPTVSNYYTNLMPKLAVPLDNYTGMSQCCDRYIASNRPSAVTATATRRTSSVQSATSSASASNGNDVNYPTRRLSGSTQNNKRDGIAALSLNTVTTSSPRATAAQYRTKPLVSPFGSFVYLNVPTFGKYSIYPNKNSTSTYQMEVPYNVGYDFIDVVFNSTDEVVVEYCYTFRYITASIACVSQAEFLKQLQPLSLLPPSRGFHHVFRVPITLGYIVEHWFRVIEPDQGASCLSPDRDEGMTFWKYILEFDHHCTASPQPNHK